MTRMYRWFASLLIGLVFVGLAALLGGCGSEPPASSYKQTLLQHRLEKDMDLRDAKNPVLDRGMRARFAGLRYYQPDTTYRFEVPLVRAPEPETVFVAQRVGGQMLPKVKVGYVEIPFPQGSEELAVFQNEEEPGVLWIPFTDATTGTETYGAGRYIDAPLHDDGTVLVDFNKAYNPLCDYNPDKYNCAIPPAGNRLPFPIPAGEKKSLLAES